MKPSPESPTKNAKSCVCPSAERSRTRSRRNMWSSLLGRTRCLFHGRLEDTARRRLPGYELCDKLGEGGMGVVYKARHLRSGQWSAVKLQKAEHCSAEARARFAREVRITRLLAHENTVSVRDDGETTDGVPYYTMELLHGSTLDELVETAGPLSPERTVRVLSGVLAALVALHGKGYVHRDIKPSNVFLCQGADDRDDVRLIDFGLVKDLRDTQSELDEAGKVLGTPEYLAPETIVLPSEVGPQTDLYAVGALAYFLLTGEAPFSGGSVVEVCCHHLHSPVVPPSWRASQPIPEELEALVLACLQKDRCRRPSSAAELLKRLGACMSREAVFSDARRAVA